MIVIAGDTVRLRCEFRTWAGDYGDPENIILNVYSPNKLRLIESIALTVANKISVGIYEADYTVPLVITNLPSPSDIIYEFVGELEDTQILGQGKFTRIINI